MKGIEVTFRILIILAIVFFGVFNRPSGSSRGASADNSPTVISTIKIQAGGYSPISVAVNPSTNRVYVANHGSNNVSVIDGANNAIVASVSVGSKPNAVAVNSSTNRIYVANTESNSISVISGASNSVIATVYAGSGPVAIAVNPYTNLIYVVNDTNTISVIDGSSNEATTTLYLSVANGSAVVAVNSVTNRIYVTSANNKDVYVIDGASNDVVATVSVGTVGYCRNLTVNPNTNRIYMTNGTNVTVIDGAINAVVATTEVGLSMSVAVNPTTNTIFVGGYNYYPVTMIDGTTNTVVANDGGIYLASSLAVNPTTNRIYVADSASNSVSIISGVTNTVIKIVKVGNYTRGVAVNPSTNRIYVANWNSSVMVIDGTTNAVVAAIGVGGQPDAIAVNPSTNRIFVTNGSNNVFVIDGATNTVVATVYVGSIASGLAVNLGTNRIYVSHASSNTVSVINGATNSVVATVRVNSGVGNLPYGIALNPHTNHIYVNSDTAFSVIDGETNSVTATAFAGLYLSSVAVNPTTNRIYLAGGNYISVIDGATNVEIARVLAFNPPPCVAVNSSTNRIYVSHSDNTISIFDGATNSLVNTVLVGNVAWGVAVNSTTNRIYVANYGSDTISVIQDVDSLPPGIIELRIADNNLNSLKDFDSPPAYITIENSPSKYSKLLWQNYGANLDVLHKQPLGQYTQLLDHQGYLPGECVSAAKALSASVLNTDDWEKGSPVMGGTVTEGTVIATFFADKGTKYPNYPEYPYYVNGQKKYGHTAIFKEYTYDKDNNITGFWVWDQNWDLGGVMGKHIITQLNAEGSTADANNYNVVMIPPGQVSKTSIQNGGASVVHNSGVAVNITGSSAPDGTSVTVSSVNFGNSSPSGIAAIKQDGIQYYDVFVNLSSDHIADESAKISITNPAVTNQMKMPYWFQEAWHYASDIFISGTTISGMIPIFALGGTPIAIGDITSLPSELAFTTQPTGGVAGNPFSTQPVVAIKDVLGNTVTSDNSTMVTLSISGNATAIISGNTTVTAINGEAAFSGLSIDEAGIYSLTASSLNLISATSVSFNITDHQSVPVNLSINLQGNQRPDSGWMVPLTVNFFISGNTTPVDVLNATPAFSFNTTTVKGLNVATAIIDNIMPGVYDIAAVSPHTLLNVKRNILILGNNSSVNLSTLLEGNANDDNKINIQDFGVLAATYGKQRGQIGFDERADFDCNDKINITDFGLLAANYGKYSPVEIP